MKVSVAVRQKFHGFNLANELAFKGVLKKLYTSYYGKILGRDNSHGFFIDKSFVKTNFYSAFWTYALKNKYPLFSDKYFGKWVADKIGEEDIIITWGIQALPIILRAKQLGIKVILERGSSHVTEQRDLLMEEYRRYRVNTRSLEASFSEARMQRELLEYDLADIVSIPSKFVERTFIKHGFDRRKLFVNNYGVSIDEFKYEPTPSNKFIIINAGKQSLRKGSHYLLQAFGELSLPQAELWLIGNVEEELNTFIYKQASASIKFIPPVPQKELKDYYNKADVFVICSIEEGLAMVQLQAMACGLPVICTTNTGGDDFIEDGIDGFVLPVQDVRALKDALLYAYFNKDKMNEMGQNALKKANNGYTWADYGTRAIEKYQHLI